MPRKTFDIIKMTLRGCTNRPFYQIVLLKNTSDRDAPPIEQLGTYDPMPNIFNEKIVSLDLDRIKFHLAHGVALSKPVEILLGLGGFFPVHPISYLTAMRNRKKLQCEKAELEKTNVENEKQ